jgi:hypothetical protein
MKYADSHLSDEQLLRDVDGELPSREEKVVRAHLEACWKCRSRRHELDRGIGDFIGVHQKEFDAKLPPAAGPRALLKARLAELSAREPDSPWFGFPRFTLRFTWVPAAATCALAALCVFLVRSSVERESPPRRSPVVVSIPDAAITPGAALLVSRPAVCSQALTKNKVVPVALQRKVFEEYGIAGADPRAYEVDYLVTPALGGADDIHNLWPHSYSATVWNAQVKDALEDRLREMVCDGSLDLAEAQREIASNWITAYKKYFHTDQPLAEHTTSSQTLQRVE